MTKYKKCAQCGCVKLEDDFKIKYTRTDGTKLRNPYCRLCEEDTRNYRALTKLLDAHCISLGQEQQLAKYVEVFRLLESQGLSTPLSRKSGDKANTERIRINPEQRLESLMQRYSTGTATPVSAVQQPSDAATQAPSEATVPVDTTDVPEGLQQWLTGSFDEWYEKLFTPEYLNESVYPTLKSAYRKEIGWNAVTLTPEYDDTYKDVLNRISDRFWDYEDWYREHTKDTERSTDNNGNE